MSTAMEFFKKASEDSALKAAVKAAIEKAATKDEEVLAVAKIASEAGFNVSADELKAVVTKTLQQTGQLSDEELENVAGGTMNQSMYEDAGRAVDGAVTDAANTVAGGVTDAANTVAGGVSDAANVVASFFSGW